MQSDDRCARLWFLTSRATPQFPHFLYPFSPTLEAYARQNYLNRRTLRRPQPHVNGSRRRLPARRRIGHRTRRA